VVAEEHERLAADLVDRVVAGAGVDGDVRHRQRQLMHVGDGRGRAAVVHHDVSVVPKEDVMAVGRAARRAARTAADAVRAESAG